MDYLPTEIIIQLKDGASKTKARVILKFGLMVIKGFRIQSSNFDSVWVTPPAYRSSNSKTGYVPIVFFEDIEIWKHIEKMIVEKYDEKVSDPQPQEENEEIDISEIKV